MKKKLIKTILKTFLVLLCGAMVAVVDSAYSRTKIEEVVTGEVRTLQIMTLKTKEQEKNEIIAAINGSTASVLKCLINFGARPDPALALLVAKTVAANPSSQITTLNFAKNHIGDKCILDILEAFAEKHYSKLTTLDFSGNDLTDVGATAIAISLLGLRPTTLNLSGNHIGAIGISGIMEGFLTSDNLQSIELDFSENNIGDAGAAAIADILLRNPNLRLRSLKVANNNISRMGVEALINALLVSSTDTTETTIFDFSGNNLNATEEGEMARRFARDALEASGASLSATTTLCALFLFLSI